MKLWQLQSPKPSLSDQYDVIFIDEAQDCTPGNASRGAVTFYLSVCQSFLPPPLPSAAIMDVLLSQPCGKILVGDPHQQIYTFRGAVNALQIVSHTHIYYLTQVNASGTQAATRRRLVPKPQKC